MDQQGTLSTRFNTSLGYIPVFAAMLLCKYMASDAALYTGAGAGLLLSLFSIRERNMHIPQLLLYSSTGVLLLLSAASLCIRPLCPPALLPFVLEVAGIIPPLLLFFFREKILNCPVRPASRCCRQLYKQGVEAAIVSSRVILLTSILHLLIISVTLLIAYPLGSTVFYILFTLAPPVVLVLAAVFNQFGILYFNSLAGHILFVPIVNEQGNVCGKALASEALGRKQSLPCPVIRIAVNVHGMLYLLPRPQGCCFEKTLMDLPVEGCLLYGETLEQGAYRTLCKALPDASPDDLHFHFVYHFENEATNRLIYLYSIDMEDMPDLYAPAYKGGKLWTFQQMEQNLGKQFFCSCLEYEFEQLKEVIYTREKYRGS